MKTKIKKFSSIILFIFTTLVAYSQKEKDINHEYVEAQQEIAETMNGIVQSIKDGDVDKLIAFHAYGPKFTEFKMGEARVGSTENESHERNVFGNVTEVVKFDAKDLKIAVYHGNVANVTFHSDFHLKFGEDLVVVNDQISLLFVKIKKGDWKIVHEHHSPLKTKDPDSENEYIEKVATISKKDFPKGDVINLVKDWGGMAVAINEAPAGTDFSPLLKNQKDGLCQVPHWGYLEKGVVKMIHKDKSTKMISAGEVFYMPPGHTAVVLEDIRLIDFSPQDEMVKLVEDINTIIAGSKD